MAWDRHGSGTMGIVTAAKPRVPYWDNAKWIAIALVVIGHTVQPLASQNDIGQAPYLLIYAFHMPLFGVVSGYFTTDAPTPRHYARVVTDLLVPYLLFEAIWSIIRSLLTGRWTFDPTTASWTLWFLLALAAFRVLLPVLARVRWPLAWVVAAAVLVGYWDGVDQTLSTMRIFGMMPFFVLGWELRRSGIIDRWVARERVTWVRVGALAVFAASLAIFLAFPDLWRSIDLRHWFFLDRAFDDIGAGEQWYSGAVRILIMLWTTVLVAAALALVPRRQTFFTDWGSATMYVYLLHTFILFWPREFDWFDPWASQWWMPLVSIVLGLAITMLLSTRLVRTLTSWLVEPKVPWLLRSEPEAPAKPAKRPG